MYLIIGRTGSGKTHLAELLKQRGLKPVVSRTTRPPRYPGEDSYIFVSKDEAYACEDSLTETEINGYLYYVTENDLKDKDFYIIDPIGAKYLIRFYEDMADENFDPTQMFNIVYIIAPYSHRRYHATHRVGGYLTEEFCRRDDSEDGQFFMFEKDLTYITNTHHAIADVLVIRNTYDPEHLEKYADDIARNIKLNARND